MELLVQIAVDHVFAHHVDELAAHQGAVIVRVWDVEISGMCCIQRTITKGNGAEPSRYLGARRLLTGFLEAEV